MLRITRIPDDSVPTLKLEGKLLAPWVGAVLEACVHEPSRGSRLQLDLSAVSHMDTAGAELLRDFTRRGMVDIGDCSSFVAALLHLEGDQAKRPR